MATYAAPVPPTHPYLQTPPLAFAHRGGAAIGEENTAAAFAAAVAMGYRYLETDVRATLDKVAVLVHDPDLTVSGTRRPVAALRWADLATCRDSGETSVLRLDEALHSWPGARFNLDAKEPGAIGPMLDALRRTDAWSRCLLASFSDERLAAIRRMAPRQVATSLGVGEISRLWAAAHLRRGRYRPPRGAVAAQIPIRHRGIPVTTGRLIRTAHAAGLAVHVWTVDEPAVMHRLLDQGVDGIMSDRIDLLRDVFTERGLWTAAEDGTVDAGNTGTETTEPGTSADD